MPPELPTHCAPSSGLTGTTKSWTGPTGTASMATWSELALQPELVGTPSFSWATWTHTSLPSGRGATGITSRPAGSTARVIRVGSPTATMIPWETPRYESVCSVVT